MSPLETKETIAEKIRIIRAEIETETEKINSLSTFYNYLQVRTWRKRKRLLKQKLAYYKQRAKLYADPPQKKQA